MARGIFAGMIVGVAVSGLAVGTASVMTDIPGAGAPEATTLEVPAGSQFDQSREDTEAELPGSEATPDAGGMSQVTAPEPDDLSAIGEGATESAALPETGSAEGTLSAPATGDAASGIEVDSDSPVLPSPQSVAPAAPTGEDDLSISTEPAQPLVPDVAEESSAFREADGAVEAETEAEVIAAEPEADATADTPDMPTEPEDTDPVDKATAEDVQALTEPEPESTSTFENMADKVETNRLPSVSDTPETDDSGGDADAAETPSEDTRPPLQRYAAAFENPDDKPLMAIVLIDDGTSQIGFEALKSFPYPLSFAIDAGWAGAGDAMRAYRDAGLEVLAMAGLPEGAGATDTEVAMQIYFKAVPEAVAIMEGPGGRLQRGREVSAQLAQILKASGHGLVMFPNGLNTAKKLIAREGVPAATVFRDFDVKGQNATVIRRFLDQAAFKAGQEKGGVIMVGRLQADTISALLLWGLQDRASRVALAPVSAVLSGQ